ncbi:MAG: hypothetical protein WCQ50_18040 [Spirochaetota bacterium]
MKIESEALAAVVIPEHGAKLASLRSLSSGREFLFQRPGVKYRRSSYDSDYLAGECSGFDEVCPTVLEYFYDREPWKGIRIPDHGEVWALPWSCETDSESLDLSVRGVRLPYQLRKRITLAEPDCLRISYELTNETAFPIDFIWCAHIMLEAEKGCRIAGPRDMGRCVATMSESGAIGAWGEEFDYPVTPLKDGSSYDASLHRGADADDYQKFFFKGRVPEGRAGLEYPDGHVLTVSFPEREVPCFAAIQAEGGKLGIRCVFLEPSTAAFDRPDLARLKGLNSVLPPKGRLVWHLGLRVTLPS